MRRFPLLIPVVLAVALVAGACSFVTPTTYLSIGKAPAPMADGLALPATAGSGSAAKAAAAKPVAVDTNKTLDLVADSNVTIDLTGSWMTWTPLRYQEGPTGDWGTSPTTTEWACPSGMYAYFESFSLLGTGALGNALDDILAQASGATNALITQLPAWGSPFVYGAQCGNAFNGKTITLKAPPITTTGSTYLFITTTSSTKQPLLFRYRSGVEIPVDGFGLPIQGTAWVKVGLKEAGPATAPTARLIARSTPVLLGGGAFTEPRTLWREVDARLSTDETGGALTYSWDLNGDGVYGDVSDSPDPAGTLPAGVAIVPNSVLAPIAVAGGDATVGVRVTNTAGLSSTATTSLKPLPDSSYDSNYRNWFTLDTATPVVGASLSLALNMDSEFGGKACIDANADGVYESTQNIPFTNPPPAVATFSTTALAAGPHEVRVAFIAGYSQSTCATPAAEPHPLVFRQVYTSVAARAGAVHGTVRASSYSGTTTIRLSKGKTLRASGKAPSTMRLDGLVFGGRYRWSTPLRGNGAARPGALAAFAGGRYVARADRMTVVGGAAHEVGVGSGYMLMRGTGITDLLCLALTSPGPIQNTLILGGTGAGARLHGSLSGASLMMPFDAIGLVGVTGTGKNLQPEFGQVKPFSNTATIAASSGAARKLPVDCRALVQYLPGSDNGGGSDTPSVVTG